MNCKRSRALRYVQTILASTLRFFLAKQIHLTLTINSIAYENLKLIVILRNFALDIRNGTPTMYIQYRGTKKFGNTGLNNVNQNSHCAFKKTVPEKNKKDP